MTVTTPTRPPDQDELQALIEEARRRARRRRRGYVIAFLLAALSAAALYVILGRGGGGAAGSARSAPSTGVGPQTFGPGQFWYTRTISSQDESLPAGGTLERPGGYFHPIGPKVRLELRLSDERWVGVDGTIRERMVVASVRFASAADRAKWERTHPLVPHEPGYAAAYRRPMPDFNQPGWIGSHDGITVGGDAFPPQPWYKGGEWLGPSGWDVGDSLFTHRQLLSLPSRSAALRARLKQAEQALAQREARTSRHGAIGAQTDALGQLTDIASLLTSPLPASERLAFFHAATTMPDAKLNRHVRDSLGRRGVAVSAYRGSGRLQTLERLIFSPTTGALLENAPNDAVVAQGAVDSTYALPKGINPIHPAGAPPQPQTPAISPKVGKPTTTFKLKLSTPARRQPQPAPALNWMLIGTPAPQCFAGFQPRPAPLAPAASTRQAGSTTHIYRLTPTNAHRRTWCPGRYELTIMPDYSRRSRLPSASPNLSPGLTTSIFFQVK